MHGTTKCATWKVVVGGVVVLLALATVLLCVIQRNGFTFKMTNNEGLEVSRQKRSSESIDQSSGGAVYTRWGRTTCPKDADLVYNGAAGGSLFSNPGGAAEYLCLPSDPLWGVYTGGSKSANVYGTEYISPTSSFKVENSNGQNAHNHNVPCAVCISKTRVSTIMIPARNLCYQGWSLEYSGYLVTSHHAHAGRTQFVCVDESPETDPAGYRADTGAYMWNVEAVCGALKCPPYIVNRELTCVVCTK